MEKSAFTITGKALCVFFAGVFFIYTAFASFASLDLTISAQDTNSVTVAWPDRGLFMLQTNGNLITPNWGIYGGSMATTNGTNSVTIKPLADTEFFRLTDGSPTNISGMVFFESEKTLAPPPPFANGASNSITGWTDTVNNIAMNYQSNAPYAFITPSGPGNSILESFDAPNTYTIQPYYSASPGLAFNSLNSWAASGNTLATALTNNVLTNYTKGGSNFTFWIVFRPLIASNTTPSFISIFGDDAGHGILLATNVLASYWNGKISYSSLVLNYTNPFNGSMGQTYDILDSGGTIYSNGVIMAAGIGQPTNCFPFNAIGHATPGHTVMGFIQDIGIWTNHLLTATDASNLDYWYWNQGVTNILAGLIAWWPLTNSSGTNITDMSGNGNTLIISPPDSEFLWINGSPFGGNCLDFVDGSEWATNINPATADNLKNFTVTCWVMGTHLDGAEGTWVGKGLSSYAENVLGINIPGWAMFSDGKSDAGFGEYDDSGPFYETTHFNDPPYVSPFLGDGNWHFCVGENFSTNFFFPVFYVDGAQIISNPHNSVEGTGTITNISNIYPVYIGATPCVLSDVRIYNRILSPQEIQDLYKWRGRP
jgi:hypothetical protein